MIQGTGRQEDTCDTGDRKTGGHRVQGTRRTQVIQGKGRQEDTGDTGDRMTGGQTGRGQRTAICRGGRGLYVCTLELGWSTFFLKVHIILICNGV